MKTCLSCGYRNYDHAKICESCHTPFSPKVSSIISNSVQTNNKTIKEQHINSLSISYWAKIIKAVTIVIGSLILLISLFLTKYSWIIPLGGLISFGFSILLGYFYQDILLGYATIVKSGEKYLYDESEKK